MSRFLDDQLLGPAITNLMKGQDLRCAVAFWGNGASRALFPRGRTPANAKLICELTMGGSNPAELRALGAPGSKSIKHLPGLHAKVYLSSKGLITCSANASNNGVGFLAVAGLVEAGTFHESDSAAYKSASRWFEKIWNKASLVDESALGSAQKAWDRRPRGGGSLVAGLPPDPESLFDFVAGNPARFRGVGFAFTTGNAVLEDREEAAEAIIANDKRMKDPIFGKPERSALTNWPIYDVFTGWGPQDISAWPQFFVCAHLGPQGGFS